MYNPRLILITLEISLEKNIIRMRGLITKSWKRAVHLVAASDFEGPGIK
jgi:hypothetical protein